MRTYTLGLLLLMSCAGAHHPAPAAPRPPVTGSLAERARLAAAGTPAAAAIASLRAAGPAGLDAVLAAYDAEPDPARKARLRAAIDQVARQRDAHVSRLYWYTDLEEAKRAAQAAARPILSLRMLGDLGDELSCANSRFFRTTLYANAAVSAALRDRFVLHFSSERPAPLITIDFRDGRKIQRTVTGNSLHYVLDAAGRPVDAIPGLYGPQAFLRVLGRAAALWRETTGLSGRERAAALRRAHTAHLEDLRAAWVQDLGTLEALPAPVAAGLRPPALAAVPAAMAKAVVEMPMVRAIALPTGDFAELPPDQRPWPAIAARHAEDARLDARSIALMREKRPMDWSGGVPRPLDEAAFSALVARFERTMAEDTVRNEYLFHARILGWLARRPEIPLAELNRRVYAELFLTPKDDPWLGLVPPQAYTGIADDGVVR
jgi:hypothetical protein